MPLPPGFTAIKDATSPASQASFIGVIVSIKEQRKTKGTDWVLDFTIQDDFTSGAIGSSSCIAVRIFRHTPDQFPKINGIGDVALVRNFRLESWALSMVCIYVNPSQSGLLVFPADKIPVPELSQAYQLGNSHLVSSAMFGSRDPTAQEQMAVINLKHAASGSVQQTTQHRATTSSFTATKNERISLIKHLDFNKYYDIRAQVVNVYWNNIGSVDLKVTDYTANKDLFLYADPDDPDNWYQDKEWKGPYGQFTLDVRLYGTNASFARENLTVGDFVFLRNVHTKLSPANKLEGVVHEDRHRPNQVDIRRLTNIADIDEIKQRKHAYEQQRTKKSAFEELRNAPKKSSTKAAKKTEKKAKLKLQRAQEQKEIEAQAEVWEAQRTGVNLNVRAAFPEMQLSTISEIIYNPRLSGQTPTKYNDFKMPFVNCKHRARVRVIDFFPPELELFAHYINDSTWNKKTKTSDADHSKAKGRWEWGFVLLLEDANLPANTVSEKLRVNVGNDAAQHLLNMDARDLRNNSKTLEQLKEKLFILWGNLLELKTELRDRGSDLPLPPGDNRLQNKPFDCCIEEYGHEVRVSEGNPAGYQRMHKLAGTKIQSEVL